MSTKVASKPNNAARAGAAIIGADANFITFPANMPGDSSPKSAATEQQGNGDRSPDGGSQSQTGTAQMLQEGNQIYP
tara:strand:+ start:1943 stop:2173 length:231 start_codon:yes stop_codon:yes gene_type:complete